MNFPCRYDKLHSLVDDLLRRVIVSNTFDDSLHPFVDTIPSSVNKKYSFFDVFLKSIIKPKSLVEIQARNNKLKKILLHNTIIEDTNMNEFGIAFLRVPLDNIKFD